jgi:putative ubiquitin-RnfH superfamily antitoxin RatB of RatAB toxin-antitoxin module
MQVSIIYAEKDQVYKCNCEIATGASLQDLLLAEKDTLASWPAAAPYECSVYGQCIDGSYILEDGDRIEILRPLTISPMEARRLRAQKKGKKG